MCINTDKSQDYFLLGVLYNNSDKKSSKFVSWYQPILVILLKETTPRTNWLKESEQYTWFATWTNTKVIVNYRTNKNMK